MDRFQRFTPLIQLVILIAVLVVGITLHRDLIETQRFTKIAAAQASAASSNAGDAKDSADNAESEAEGAKSAAEDALDAINSR